MSIIEVRDLSKVFSVKRKQAGLRGSLRSIVQPDFQRVVPLNVVRGLDVNGLLLLTLVAIAITIIASRMFYVGLKRYESGSAINVNV
jgi:hypothetical protein